MMIINENDHIYYRFYFYQLQRSLKDKLYKQIRRREREREKERKREQNKRVRYFPFVSFVPDII